MALLRRLAGSSGTGVSPVPRRSAPPSPKTNMGEDAHATQSAAFRLRRQNANFVRNWYYPIWFFAV
ncbi:hypothetical protein OH491_18695 [Termitidicoccus mucosus]|uniref:Uncharacterized protein n=1 Tax=Termitidicoccus mucosus TaxID=1184151 RepID=A0A178IK01_9BACT|nr:hypothetical protein AW736_09925 [Opitutaceae bacterium TSB47]